MKLAILGLGLIGSSIARAAASFAGSIAGYDTHPETLRYCLEHSLIHQSCAVPEEAVAGADIVVLASPVEAMGELTRRISSALTPQTLVTDAGSVKGYVIQSTLAHLDNPEQFIPAHPIAGSEKSGPEAGTETLFRNNRVILTPTFHASTEALSRAERFWQQLGGITECMDARLHDHIYAYVSHLPHYLAFRLAEIGEASPGQQRLAHSSRSLWEGIFHANATALHHAKTKAMSIEAVGHSVAEASAYCVMKAAEACEWNIGHPVLPYAGAGFADFTQCIDPKAPTSHLSMNIKEKLAATLS